MHRPILVFSLSLLAACASSSHSTSAVHDSSGRASLLDSEAIAGRVVLAVEAVPLTEVVRDVADQAGILVELDPRLEGSVTLQHGAVPWDFSLRWVAAQVGARVVHQPGGARLVPSELPGAPGRAHDGGRRCGETVGGPRR